MTHKLTPADVFADFARTAAALPKADWNEPGPAESFHCPAGIANCTGAAFPGHVAHEVRSEHPCSHHGHYDRCP